eukprot:1069789-Pleurochrysis_carterae.AAC.1
MSRLFVGARAWQSHRVHCERPRRVGRRREHVGQTANLNSRPNHQAELMSCAARPQASTCG